MTEFLRQQQLALLEWFVVRARRVEEHSLAQDKDQLLVWARATLSVDMVDGQPQMARWNLPPEEPLDSLAARCRPFVLNNDPVYWAKVINAVGYLLREPGAEDLATAAQQLRAGWRDLDKGRPGFNVFESRTGDENGDLGELVGSKALGYAWLYGDLVHANDEVLERVGDHDIDDRYRAGAVLITNVALRTIATLNVVRAAHERGLLALPDEVFTRRVTADPDAEMTISQWATAPVGATAAELEAILDGETTVAKPVGPEGS